MSASPPALRVFIIDDEVLARQRLRSLLERISSADLGCSVYVAGESGDVTEAVAIIQEAAPDVLLLDIEMPGLDGFDLVELLGENRPFIVFVTAYDAYALEAFEIHATDYLTKPVRLSRLTSCLQRIRALLTAGSTTSSSSGREPSPLRRISAHSSTGIEVVELHQVQHFETEGRLVYVHFGNRKKRVEFTLDELENQLPYDDFLRIHRSIIVRTACISRIEPWFSGNWRAIMENGTQLTIARRRVRRVKQAIGYGTA